MNPGVFWIAWRSFLHHRLRNGILLACLAVGLFLPLASRLLVARYQEELGARARATPLLGGPRGGSLELVLEALAFRRAAHPPLPLAEARALEAEDRGLVIPLQLRNTARGRPLVGTVAEYFELRGLRPAAGRLPLRTGEAVLGAEAARALGLGPGDLLATDPREILDLARPPSLRLRITGVLAESGSPDDRAVFTDLRTIWAVEGYAHAHADPARVPEDQVLAEAGEVRELSPALPVAEVLEPGDLAGLHVHGDEGRLPLSCLIFLPRDARAATLVRTRWNDAPDRQMVEPARVIEDLFVLVLQVRAWFDRFALLLGVSTALLAALVLSLDLRLRQREMETLRRIGCAPGTVLLLRTVETGVLLLGAVLLAVLASGLVLWITPDLVTSL